MRAYEDKERNKVEIEDRKKEIEKQRAKWRMKERKGESKKMEILLTERFSDWKDGKNDEKCKRKSRQMQRTVRERKSRITVIQKRKEGKNIPNISFNIK